jgi:hypothetical protein
MAVIYPPVIDRELCNSSAEHSVFEKIQNDFPADWHCIHSQWIKNSGVKIISEVDFVLITDKAILCLEIKGGNIIREPGGKWKFYSRNGIIKNEKAEGPFLQSKNACYDLKNHLESVGFRDIFASHPWTWGVVTPDCQMDLSATDAEIASEQYCGLVQYEDSFETFIRNLCQYAQKRKITVTGREGKEISEIQRRRIISILKPTIGYIDLVSSQVVKTEAGIKRLTDEQYRVLRLLHKEKRIILSGGAGTGKTVLAFEQARLHAQLGKKVLLTCFNRPLADELAKRAGANPEMSSVKVINLHRLLYSICREAGQDTSWTESWLNENESVYDHFLKAALEVQDLEQFDYIVIDETQDLMRSDFFKVLSDLLKGNNIWEGDWTICIDEEQKIFDSQYDKQLHDKILDSGTQLSLNENLRNTKEIASWTYGLSGVNTAPVSRLTGAQPILDYYRSASEDLAKKLQRDINRQLKALSDIGLPASNLVVLLAQKHPYLDILDNASQNTIKKMAKYGDVHDNNEYFLWSTVQSFKGLEAVSIILLGIENIEKKSIRKLIYVGGSRARSLLTIFFQEDQADSVQNRLTDVFSYLT